MNIFNQNTIMALAGAILYLLVFFLSGEVTTYYILALAISFLTTTFIFINSHKDKQILPIILLLLSGIIAGIVLLYWSSQDPMARTSLVSPLILNILPILTGMISSFIAIKTIKMAKNTLNSKRI